MTIARLTPEEWLGRLVGFDTVSAKSNLALIEEIADELDRQGIRPRLSYDDRRGKANLFATIGPEDRGGYVLSGHTDVVPVAGQDWSADPFTLVERADRLYGRGSADMKGFIACALALVPEFRASRLATPIHLAFSFDEEVGCLGVRRLLETIEGPMPLLAIVGEPTMMRVVNAHKGIHVHATTVTGRAGHSSRPQDGVNAVVFASEIVAFLDRLAGALAGAIGNDARFDPPGTTLSVGTIAGGTAVNIIPSECRIVWEMRPVPGVSAEDVRARLHAFVAAEILPRMRAVDRAATVTTVQIASAPALAAEQNSPAEALALSCAHASETHAASFVTEAALFRAAGISAVVCGPGSIEEAHQPDEFIARTELASCIAFLRRLARRAAAT